MDVLLVSASPDDEECSRYVFESTKECFEKSGFPFGKFRMLERRNCSEAAKMVNESGLVMLCGGHVPTQNRFFNEIGLKEILQEYGGVVIGCSAGSMNCADFVYSHPELPGEASDPSYNRFLRGLALTDINMVPHYEDTKDARVDGIRLIEDICLADSWGRHLLSICDGVFVDVDPSTGRKEVMGDSIVLENRNIYKFEETHNFMNIIFISPHFPATYAHFCSNLRRNGANVFAIADCPWEELSDELRSSLTEYYKVNNLEDYNEVYRAVAYLSFKHGKMDWIESNNEYWLEQDARLRTDFNITTGIRTDHIDAIKNKSQMKKYYALAKVPTARQISAAEGPAAVREFALKAGWPLIAKPDNGVGASGTYKFCGEEDVDNFFRTHPLNYGAFVVEEFVTGLLVSYDAVYDSKGEPIFESMGVYPTPIMDIVHGNLESNYYVDKTVPAALKDAGRRTVKAFGIKSRFVHCEFFKLDRDREGLGKKGDYVGLEVNMRPAGGFTPHMMDSAHSTDVFKIWADMVCFDECRTPQGEQYVCAYASRRDNTPYKYSHEDIYANYGSNIVLHQRMPAVLAGALGDYFYIARFASVKEAKQYFDFVSAK